MLPLTCFTSMGAFTAQRVAVLRAVAGNRHATADVIADAVRDETGTVSRQAVYDALGALAATGIIRRIEPAGSPAGYEDRVGDNHHHHLVCRACGCLDDVDCATGDAASLVPSDDRDFVGDEAEVSTGASVPDVAQTQPDPISRSTRGGP